MVRPNFLQSLYTTCSVLRLLALAAAFSATPGLAEAQETAVNAAGSSNALDHARRVEARALRSSFAELEVFGHAAVARRDDEGLSRLQHVTRIFINQGDFAAAETWNGRLTRSAQAQKSLRYLEVAQINTLQVRHLRDRAVSVADFEVEVDRTTHWLSRTFAQTALARRLLDEGRIGDSLRLVAKTLPLIPPERATEASVGAAVWDFASIAHAMVDDVAGYLTAIGHAESLIGASSYPRPDYESIYNLAQSLSYLGRHEEALVLADIYARLAARTATPTSTAYAGNICAFVSASREDWPAVLRCLEPYGSSLNVPSIAKNAMLPFRATAYARTGAVAEAQRDVAELRGRIERGEMAAGGGVMRAEAELLIAKGDVARGVPALRQYHLSRFQRVSRTAAAAMEQVVGNIDDQLQAAKEQSQLKSDIISIHRWLTALLVALGVALAGMVILLLRHRRLFRQMAFTDSLTGAANRRYSEVRLQELLGHARARQRPLTFALIDLDYFKSCNDRFGHDAGDEALQRFATVAKNALRPGDLFGRWGGEEFLLALPDVDAEGATVVLERIRMAAAQERLKLAPGYTLHFSAGAVNCSSSEASLVDLIGAADHALYAAKVQGRNRTVVASRLSHVDETVQPTGLSALESTSSSISGSSPFHP